MDAQKEISEKKSAETKTDSEIRDKPQTNEFIREINTLKEGLDSTKEDAKKVIEEMKSLYQEIKLGGKSEAVQQVQQEQEETPSDYMKRVLRGDVSFK